MHLTVLSQSEKTKKQKQLLQETKNKVKKVLRQKLKNKKLKLTVGNTKKSTVQL